MFHTSNNEAEKTVVLGQLHRQSNLPSPVLDLPACPTDLMGELTNGQNEKHEQDQIDQWLASCSLLSPNGTIDMGSLKTGDFTWQELSKDMSYFDNVDDSGDDGASSQETQLEDFDMNDRPQ
ncbi:hypothetical protein COL922a_003627 [Colletotrichum nupharicola]|nr:hypothetical protein COL922a_003627 [Colletotrichum nupharicola]